MRRVLALALAAALLAAPAAGQAQETRVYRIGVILHGGTYAAALGLPGEKLVA